MNKQELIKKYEKEAEFIYGFPVIRLSLILEDLKQLDEPQKVKIPKFVAECIEYAQASDWDLEDVFQSIANELDTSEIPEWFTLKVRIWILWPALGCMVMKSNRKSGTRLDLKIFAKKQTT